MPGAKRQLYVVYKSTALSYPAEAEAENVAETQVAAEEAVIEAVAASTESEVLPRRSLVDGMVGWVSGFFTQKEEITAGELGTETEAVGEKAEKEEDARPTIGDCVEVTYGKHSGRCGTIIEDEDDDEPFKVKLLNGKKTSYLRATDVRKVEPAEMERRLVAERAQAEQSLRDAMASSDAARLRKAVKYAKGLADPALVEQAQVAWTLAHKELLEQELRTAMASAESSQLRMAIDAAEDEDGVDTALLRQAIAEAVRHAEQGLRDAIASADAERLRSAINTAERWDEDNIDAALVREAEAMAEVAKAEQRLRDAIASAETVRLRAAIDSAKRLSDIGSTQLIQQAEAAWARPIEQELRCADVARVRTALRAAHAPSGELFSGIDAALVQQATATKMAAEEKSIAAAARAKAAAYAEGQRPLRSGKWFIIHDTIFLEIEHEAVCDIHREFLSHHPNGGEKTAGFLSIKLNPEQIKKYSDVIIISSYRWEDVQGMGDEGTENMIPANYFGFLDRIRERGQILWMDWSKDQGSNLDVAEHLKPAHSPGKLLKQWRMSASTCRCPR